MTLDTVTMRRLAAIQHRRSRVTLAEIESILPIDSMTSEEIGQTMAQLEEAGIDIEFDKELLRRRIDSQHSDARTVTDPRSVVADAHEPLGGRTVKQPLQPQSAPTARQRFFAGGPWRKPSARQLALILLVLAVLFFLLIFGVVNRR